MDINEINAGWGQHVFIWAKPAEGMSWSGIERQSTPRKDDQAWRPAMVLGFCDPGDRAMYNTINDPRRVVVVGSQYHYPLEFFELGEVLVYADGMDEVKSPAIVTAF